MRSEIKIRRLNALDIPEINRIQKERGYEVIYSLYHYVGYGAFDDDKLVATAFLFPYNRVPHVDYPNGYVAELGAIYTDPNYRKQGIATRLLEEILKNASDDLPGVSAIVADALDGFYPIAKKQNCLDETESHRIWWKISKREEL